MKAKVNQIMSFLARIDWSKIDAATYTRYLLMILTALNTILTRFGINPLPVSEEGAYQAISDVLTVVVLLVNTWKNNSVTTEAICADAYLKQMKTEAKTSEEETAG